LAPGFFILRQTFCAIVRDTIMELVVMNVVLLRVQRAVLATLLLTWLAGLSRADEATQTPSQIAWEAAKHTAVVGPANIPLEDQAKLHLPGEMAFIPKREANGLMKAWGNGTAQSLTGMVVPTKDGQNWALTINHIADGYVKDSEAKDWNADALLQSLKDGTEQQNIEREKMGIAGLDVVGWIQPPAYTSDNHRLVWSVKLTDRGAAAGDAAIVNYNTYALGRDGYFQLNLLSDEARVESEKTYAHTLLSALEYNTGTRYEDFVEGTDHVAEYGIAALIAGVAAKKLGLLAVIGVFLAKFAKVILVGLAVAGGGAMKFFRRNSRA
jgi:uncharacterized membrane-anchored protein